MHAGLWNLVVKDTRSFTRVELDNKRVCLVHLDLDTTFICSSYCQRVYSTRIRKRLEESLLDYCNFFVDVNGYGRVMSGLALFRCFVQKFKRTSFLAMIGLQQSIFSRTSVGIH